MKALCAQVAFRKGMARTGFQITLKVPRQLHRFEGCIEFYFPRHEFGSVFAFARIMFSQPLLQVSRVPAIKLLWVGNALEDIGVKHQALINVLPRRGKVEIGLWLACHP
ncbi:MAG: hypothetical protein WDM80_03395 [Limisphaerales bacterium]